jgi:hypothetical protein
MEIYAGIIGFLFGVIIARLARYRKEDIEKEQSVKDTVDEHERELKLAYVNGYIARFRKEKEQRTSEN